MIHVPLDWDLAQSPVPHARSPWHKVSPGNLVKVHGRDLVVHFLSAGQKAKPHKYLYDAFFARTHPDSGIIKYNHKAKIKPPVLIRAVGSLTFAFDKGYDATNVYFKITNTFSGNEVLCMSYGKSWTVKAFPIKMDIIQHYVTHNLASANNTFNLLDTVSNTLVRNNTILHKHNDHDYKKLKFHYVPIKKLKQKTDPFSFTLAFKLHQ